MSISSDMLLTKPRWVTLKKEGETMSGIDTSLLIIGASGKFDRKFKLEPPTVRGQFLALQWDDDEKGHLSKDASLHLSDDWKPVKNATLWLVACAAFWIELARSHK